MWNGGPPHHVGESRRVWSSHRLVAINIGSREGAAHQENDDGLNHFVIVALVLVSVGLFLEITVTTGTCSGDNATFRHVVRPNFITLFQ